jgi:hypothetical protein
MMADPDTSDTLEFFEFAAARLLREYKWNTSRATDQIRIHRESGARCEYHGISQVLYRVNVQSMRQRRYGVQWPAGS